MKFSRRAAARTVDREATRRRLQWMPLVMQEASDPDCGWSGADPFASNRRVIHGIINAPVWTCRIGPA